MKFYISEETKAELESKIKDLYKRMRKSEHYDVKAMYQYRLSELYLVLNNCFVLPVLPNYQDAGIFSMKHDRENCEKKYPEGIIINHKKSRKLKC
jgi:hypothetical protein